MSLWIEKHRPSTVQQLVGSNDLVRIIETGADVKDLPNLILYGPPGTGKTSLVRILCRKVFRTAANIDERVLELNASDDRGISVVRTQIKAFASRSIHSRPGVPDFKLIVLEEADAMTDDSQAALRRIMEQYSEHTRFIILCNYVGRIIKPLLSRCVKVKFVNASDGNIDAIVRSICEKEGVTFREGHHDAIVAYLRQHTSGDLRRIINVLQRAHFVSGMGSVRQPISLDLVKQVTNSIPEDVIGSLLSSTLEGDERRIVEEATRFIGSGYGFGDALLQLSRTILTTPLIVEDAKRWRALVAIGETDVHGVQNAVQLIALLMRLRSLLL